MRVRSYHTYTAFLDLLFNTLLAFAALFVISFCMVNINKKKHNVMTKADFVITVTWPNSFDDDVDTYVEDPLGHLVFFQRREDGLLHLDRDDLGLRSDVMQTPYGPVKFNDNREIVTVRGFIPGEYIVNVHMYHRNSSNDDEAMEGETGEPDSGSVGDGENRPPCPVTVQVDKINPFTLVMIKTVELTHTGDEKTVLRFVVNEDGEVTDINYLAKNLTGGKQSPHVAGGRPPGGGIGAAPGPETSDAGPDPEDEP